jgi:hypothetical protein
MKLKILIIALIFSNLIYSQNCGTSFLPGDTVQYIGTVNNLDSEMPTCLNKKLSIHLHILGENDSTGFADIDAIRTNIDSLNVYFSPICLEFEICEFEYIKNSIYYNLIETDYLNIQELYSDSGVINIFFVSSIGGVGGKTFMPDTLSENDDLFVIADNNRKQITHQMGHYLGLTHTYETTFGNELADHSNCLTTGDLICDTEASPNISDTITTTCDYDYDLKDANNQYYTPAIYNHMSFYPDNCRREFTPRQFKIMIHTILNLRKDLH